MRTVKSVTHRTVLSHDMSDEGELVVIVVRDGRTVERIDLVAEVGLGNGKTLVKHDWGVEVVEMVGSPAREEVVETIVFEGKTRPVEQEV